MMMLAEHRPTIAHTSGVFLTWNDSRRSRSLSSLLGLPRIVLVAQLTGAWRHLLGLVATAYQLLRVRPLYILYQYSLGLGVVIAGYTVLSGGRARAFADLHTKALRRTGHPLVRPLVVAMKRWSLQTCAGTVVTTHENRQYAEATLGVCPYVLPDPLPVPAVKRRIRKGCGTPTAVFVCSFAADEPLDMIGEVARRLEGAAQVVVTGSTAGLRSGAAHALAGVRLTGWLPEAEYWQVLADADVVVVLTTERACLPCGAYEAIAVGHRPILFADAAAEEFFGEAAHYSVADAAGLEAAIRRALSDIGAPPPDAGRLHDKWCRYWQVLQPVLMGGGAQTRGHHYYRTPPDGRGS